MEDDEAKRSEEKKVLTEGKKKLITTLIEEKSKKQYTYPHPAKIANSSSTSRIWFAPTPTGTNAPPSGRMSSSSPATSRASAW